MFVCLCWGFTASQPNGVMSSAVSLPNHTFPGQALSSKRLTSIVHTLSPETDNCPSWISGRERMTIENISVKKINHSYRSLGSNLGCLHDRQTLYHIAIKAKAQLFKTNNVIS